MADPKEEEEEEAKEGAGKEEERAPQSKEGAALAQELEKQLPSTGAWCVAHATLVSVNKGTRLACVPRRLSAEGAVLAEVVRVHLARAT